MANRILPGYLMQVGDKIEVVVDHDGPASYSNVNTNSGTGDVINASDLGVGGFEDVNADGLSSDGTNYVFATPIGGGGGNAVTQLQLQWYVRSSNAEVANAVNLSGKSIRLRIRCV